MRFDEFQHPQNILMPAPFWVISDRITPEETAPPGQHRTRQVVTTETRRAQSNGE